MQYWQAFYLVDAAGIYLSANEATIGA
jgi:hypothetical protein